MAPKRTASTAASNASAKSAKASSKAKSAPAKPAVAATKRKSTKIEDAVEAPPSKRSKSSESATDSDEESIPAKGPTKAKPKAKTPAKSATTKAKASAKPPTKPAKPSSKATRKRDAEQSESDDEPPSKRSKNVPAEKEAPKAAKPALNKSAAKNSTAKKPAAKPAAKKPAAKTTGAVVEDQSSAEDDAPAKKHAVPKKVTAPRNIAGPKSRKQPAKVNSPPTTPLHVFVFGSGSQGELGLGHKQTANNKVIDVKRPRLNPFLETLDVVQIAVGGMHCAVLTADNRIFTWGVNDQGALGRSTKQEGKMEERSPDANDEDSDDDSDDEDSGLNSAEAEPREVDPKHFPEGTRFASLFAGDSTTFVLTTTGLVYGWGTFRGNDGILGFSKDEKSKKGKAIATQNVPALIPELKNIKTMAVGANHAIALTHKGKAFIWGAGEQSQLGRRVVARTAAGALVPREFGLQKKFIVDVATGEYCSYAFGKDGEIYSWGHNGYGQCGVALNKNVDEVVQTPTKIEFLDGKDIAQIKGGKHHAIARTTTGEALIWGRIGESQGGLKFSDMPQDSLVFHETNGQPLAAIKPITIPNLKAELVATASDTSFIITPEGAAYSWGFSTNYETGQGTDADIIEATLVDNTAVRGKKLVFAGAGGQFGILAGEKGASSTIPVKAPVRQSAVLENVNKASQAASVGASIEQPSLQGVARNSPIDQSALPEAAPAEASPNGL